MRVIFGQLFCHKPFYQVLIDFLFAADGVKFKDL